MLIATIFYLQVFFYLVLIGFGLIYKSPAFIMLAGVFGIITSVGIAAEGLSFQNGVDGGINLDTGDFNVTNSYTTYTVSDGSFLNTWHMAFLGSGLFFTITGLAVGIYGAYVNRKGG